MKLESEFSRAMEMIYIRAKEEAGYTASIFHKMLSDHGGLATAKQLLNDRRESQGYTNLWQRGRLDLTVEATVIDNPRWHALFTTEELEKARRRLAAYRYFEK